MMTNANSSDVNMNVKQLIKYPMETRHLDKLTVFPGEAYGMLPRIEQYYNL